LNIGSKPTFYRDQGRGKEPTIEAHIFNFRETIYGKDLEIYFIKKIRNERPFRNVHHLAARIAMDIVKAKRILKHTAFR